MARRLATSRQAEAAGVADDVTVLEPAPSTPLVRAAGGVLWRTGRSGDVEVLVVHRPKYDDWSLPKGKCEADEPSADCALREVEEETGYRCVLGPELATTSYVDSKGRHKEVRYWVMTLVSGGFEANDEVDEIRWQTLAEARPLLSYERDRHVLDSFSSGDDHTG
ncbi:MAG: NUDIX hydrolase [Actinobacteria bacterium]|nr:NUDIX hydrolase [Actinomycetota bacterium]